MKRQPTPQHITWFLDLERNGQLDLEPPYQRKSVWTPKDRRFFLDTIFRNYPTPPIFVHRTIDDNGFTTYYVVDGKQRLETILMFAQNKIAIDKDFGDENLNGKKFQDLSPNYKRLFWDYVLVVDFIDSVEGTNIEEVFDRVNRNAKNLQRQELRHARFDGWFINEAEDEAAEEFWWKLKVSTRARDRRMRNVQFIAELLLIILENRIVGFSQDYLDEMHAKYDYPDEFIEDFDLDAYRDKKKQVKTILAQMNEHNECIDKYGKTANNLYTLWALLSLNNDLPQVSVLADRYKSFMEGVEKFTELEKPEDKEGSPSPGGNAEYEYFSNSRGASTDFSQRNSRLFALSTIIKNENNSVD